MDPRIRQFLRDFRAANQRFDAAQPDRLDRWRNLEEDSAEVISTLLAALRPQDILEIGTSNGYSTVWLAHHARATGAHLVSIDNDASRTTAAHQTLAQVGLEQACTLVTADARDHLAQADRDSQDLILLDAERPHYVDYVDDLIRALRPGGVLVVDNVLSHAGEVAQFLGLMRSHAASDCVIPTGAGLFVAVL